MSWMRGKKSQAIAWRENPEIQNGRHPHYYYIYIHISWKPNTVWRQHLAGVLLGTQGNAVSSLNLFGWAVIKKVAIKWRIQNRHISKGHYSTSFIHRLNVTTNYWCKHQVNIAYYRLKSVCGDGWFKQSHLAWVSLRYNARVWCDVSQSNLTQY